MLDQETNVDDREKITYGGDNEENSATNRSRIKNWINQLVSTIRIIESQRTEPWETSLVNFNEVVSPQNSLSPVLEKHEKTEHQVELTSTLNLNETFSTNSTGVHHNKEPNNNEQHLENDVLQQKIGRRKRVAKYFRPQPDIEHRNNRATDTRKSWLLQNGNSSQYSALMNGNFCFACNTCTWDSVVQILANGAMDDPHYLKSLEMTTNDTLKFVQQFIEAGPSAALYRERIRVLQRLFPTKITANCNGIHALSSYSVDLWDNIATIWKVCFTSDPSASDSYHCLQCGDYTSPASTIYVNHKIIDNRGFEALQHALELHDQTKLFQCSNENCSETCTVKRKYGIQVFIELDIRPHLSWNTGVTCKLRAFPVTLQLGGHRYRLVGIAARIPGHFIAYCKRGNNIWELYNDLNLNVVRASPTTVVEPHGAIYTKIIPINKEPSLQTSPVQKLTETQNLTVKAPFNDSDVTSEDDWQNKGSSEQFCYGSEEDQNNNLEDFSKIIEAHKGETILIDGQPFQVLGSCCLTE